MRCSADVFINVPIAKHHRLARLTLGMKNLMGVILDRQAIHRNLGQRMADLASLVRPTLTVVDAVRILIANGPTGGNLDDVQARSTRSSPAPTSWPPTPTPPRCSACSRRGPRLRPSPAPRWAWAAAIWRACDIEEIDAVSAR